MSEREKIDACAGAHTVELDLRALSERLPPRDEEGNDLWRMQYLRSLPPLERFKEEYRARRSSISLWRTCRRNRGEPDDEEIFWIHGAEPMTADHHWFIERLSEAGLHAAYRRWAAGDTIVVTPIAARGPTTDPSASVIESWDYQIPVLWIYPIDKNEWGIFIESADDNPNSREVILDRVVHLFSGPAVFRRERERRRLLRRASL